MDALQHIVELRSLVSPVLELPEVILCVPWVLSLILIRYCIQGSSILASVARDNPYDMRVWTHDDLGIACRDASPSVVGNNAGYVVGPVIEIKA